ncbi:hypothetical protein [Methylobacterium oxalidis]|uniref:hypothetical protein n=1 Tax=Methylobacterium oxalidis TaxID=944322 RepID=UPI00147866BC|nr:hypothetical protein [Methylobacterium oxalidis]
MIGSRAGIHAEIGDAEPEALIETSLDATPCPDAFEEPMTRETASPPASEGP